jgi:hypothetical protein
MLKIILTVTAAAVALLSTHVYAQSDTAGEGRAATSKPATKEEKAAAKKKRQATSKEISHGKGSMDSDNTVRTGKKATADEKAAGKSSRKAAGTQASKEGSGRLEDEGKK